MSSSVLNNIEQARQAAMASSDSVPQHELNAWERFRRNKGILYIFMTLIAVIWVFPFVWMVLGAFKTQREILAQPPTFFAEHPTVSNFAMWLTQLHFGTYFVNSLIVAVVTVLGNILFCSMVGYGLAKIPFRGKGLVFGAVMVTLMVPSVATFVPLFVIVSNFHLINTYAALILPFLTQPIGVFLMRQFMDGVPDALLEAARVDGASEMRIFFQIVLPECGPAMATLAVLTFLASWNNFLWPLVASQTEDKYTLPVALSLYSTGQNATNYGILLAGSVLVITPIMILFVALQRYFVQGVAMTGIK